jgi:hypothetical protein
MVVRSLHVWLGFEPVPIAKETGWTLSDITACTRIDFPECKHNCDDEWLFVILEKGTGTSQGVQRLGYVCDVRGAEVHSPAGAGVYFVSTVSRPTLGSIQLPTLWVRGFHPASYPACTWGPPSLLSNAYFRSTQPPIQRLTGVQPTGNQILDLPASSAVPQRTTSPRTAACIMPA